MRFSRRLRWSFWGILHLVFAPMAWAQVVQLPTQRVFSLSGSMLVPDQGTASLGSEAYGRSLNSRGSGGYFSSSSAGRTSASISTRIIDLEELDRAIRQEARPALRETGFAPPTTDRSSLVPSLPPSVAPSLTAAARPPALPAGRSREVADLQRQKPIEQRADYDYLATMVHGPRPGRSTRNGEQDALFYLEQANRARDEGQWASVEVFYKLAWQSLPESKRRQLTARLNKPESVPPKASSSTSSPNPRGPSVP